MNASRKRIIAGRHFLNLLLHLRTILLQDAVFLKDAHPNHPIFQHAIFRSPEFVQFADRLRQAATTSIDSTTATFQYVAAEVANAIRTTTHALEGRMNTLGVTIANGFQRTQELIESRLLHQDGINRNVEARQTYLQETANSITRIIATVANSPDVQQIVRNAQAQNPPNSPSPANGHDTLPVVVPADPPAFEMDRSIVTAEDA